MKDLLWLNNENEEKLCADCMDVIHVANIIFEPNMEKSNELIINTPNFEQALYLVKAYLEVELWFHPCGKSLTCNYFIFAAHILKELCVRGVLIIGGDYMKSLSSLEFAVIIHDNVKDAFLEMLMTIHSLEIDVWVDMYKSFDIIARYVLIGNIFEQSFESCSSELHIGVSGIRKNLTQYIEIQETLASASNCILRVRMRSTTQLVEDVLLKYWISFNAEYGEKNKDIIQQIYV